MRKAWIATMVVLAACSGRGESNDPGDADFDATDWSTQLSARASTSVTGASAARSVGYGTTGTSSASIEIRGATPGARHPWHVHTGTCATGGPFIGEASDYPVLEVGTDGTDEATAAIGVAMVDDAPYHVNVHRSPSDLTVISCGDLRD